MGPDVEKYIEVIGHCHCCNRPIHKGDSGIVEQSFTGRLFCSEECGLIHLSSKGF